MEESLAILCKHPEPLEYLFMAPGPDHPMEQQEVQDRAIFPLRLDWHSTSGPVGLAMLQWLMIQQSQLHLSGSPALFLFCYPYALEQLEV